MNIASIDRGIYTTVEVGVGSSLISIETGNSLITFNRSETEQLIKALQQAVKELPEEPMYVLVLPSGRGSGTPCGYAYLTTLTASIAVTQSPYEVIEKGSMTLDEVERISPHYVPLAIPVEEFKQEEIGEF